MIRILINFIFIAILLKLEVSPLSHVVDTCDAGDKLIPDQDWIKQGTFDRSPDAQVSSCPLNLDFVSDPESWSWIPDSPSDIICWRSNLIVWSIVQFNFTECFIVPFYRACRHKLIDLITGLDNRIFPNQGPEISSEILTSRIFQGCSSSNVGACFS